MFEEFEIKRKDLFEKLESGYAVHSNDGKVYLIDNLGNIRCYKQSSHPSQVLNHDVELNCKGLFSHDEYRYYCNDSGNLSRAEIVILKDRGECSVIKKNKYSYTLKDSSGFMCEVSINMLLNPLYCVGMSSKEDCTTSYEKHRGYIEFLRKELKNVNLEAFEFFKTQYDKEMNLLRVEILKINDLIDSDENADIDELKKQRGQLQASIKSYENKYDEFLKNFKKYDDI